MSTKSAAWPDDEGLGSRREVAAGASIFRQGDRVKTVDFIVSGVVSVRSEVDGQDVLAGFRGPGWPLGAIPAIEGTGHVATASALNDCVLRSWRAVDFHRLRLSNQGFGACLQGMLTREALDQFRRTQVWAASNCDVRLDLLLVELMALAGDERTDGSMKLTLPIQMEWLGDMASTRRETASRHFNRRVSDGSLRREKGWVVVPSGSDLLGRIRATILGQPVATGRSSRLDRSRRTDE